MGPRGRGASQRQHPALTLRHDRSHPVTCPVHLRPGGGQAGRVGAAEWKSGTFAGKTRLSGAGRPRLRVAAWRAVWGCLQNNQVYAARYRYLTSRQTNRLKPTQAQTIVAAAILRQLYAVVATGQAWDPDIAAHGVRQANNLGVAAA